MLRSDGKKSSLQDTVFRKGFSFDQVVTEVKSMYNFEG